MSIKKNYEFDAERLATTDESGNRVYLYPEDVKGKWSERRSIFYWFLITIYLVLPWIYIKGKPFLMLNVFTREFTFMGFTYFGIEPILLFLVVISGLFFIACLTSIFGRVWCGWGCPQTVFIHTIFSKIETMTEGRARARKALDQSPWTINKLSRKSIKWILFTLISLLIAHTLIGYIVGPRELLLISLQNPSQNLGLFTATMAVSAVILFDFGWFREQFCIIACPYGRMQSVMMDENSLVIAYDKKRGEPRRGQVPRDEEGDCINCYACVKVCPTGIDIRRGTQLECVACTNCIDACNEIMQKIKKPQGLIRYSSENELSGKKHSLITPSSILYFCIFLIFITSFFIFISRITKPNLVFYHGTDSPFQIIQNPNGKQIITNHFTLQINHQGKSELYLDLELNDQSLKQKIEIISPLKRMKINKPATSVMLFFKFTPDILINGSKLIKLNLLKDNNIISTEELRLVGPN